MKTNTMLRALVGFTAVGLLSACPAPVPPPPVDAGPDEMMMDAGPEVPLWAGLCTRVEALLASPTRCTRDENCPCGSGCDLGQCKSSCALNTDCAAGLVCDSFGRCLSPEKANQPNPVSGQARGTLQLETNDVGLFTPTSEASLRFSVKTLPLSRVRLAAQAGISVACGETGTFGAECSFTNVAADETLSLVRLKVSGAFPNTLVRTSLDLFAEGQHLVVGVALHGEVAGPAVPRFGLYEGRAQLVGAGLKARTVMDTLPPELTRLELPISAEIYAPVAGVYALRLTDKRKTVFPTGSVATLGLRAGTTQWQLLMPSRQYLGADVDPTQVTGAQLDVHATAKIDNATFRDGLLDGDLVVTFEGIAPVASAPFVRWRVTLVRKGDLPAGATAPAITPSVVADPLLRASVLFADETAGRNSSPLAAGVGALLDLQKVTASLCSGTTLISTFAGATSVYGPGELSCAGGGKQKAFGLDFGTLENRGDYLTNCVAALDLNGPVAMGDASPDGSCANRTRVLTALGYATEPDRQRAFGGSVAVEPHISRQGLRLLQQWMSVQSVVGMEPRRLNALAPLLPAGSTIDKLRQFSDQQLVFTSLQRSVSGWDLLLHPRFGAPLMAAPADALNTPDYRPSYFSAGSWTGGEQKVGLPVTMLFTISQQLNGMQGLIDDLLFSRAPATQVQPVAGALADFLPRSVVIFAAAQGLHDAARSVTTPAWEDSWKASRSAWGTSTSRLLNQLDFLEQGKNPLGIEDGDLPLYRLGDQTGTTRRFSAVSDALLGREDLLDPAIAPTLIAQARDSEVLAKNSITQILQRDLDQSLQSVASDRRLEDIKRYYGDELTSMCNQYGSLTILDLVPAPDPENCFIAPDCQFSVADYQDRLNIADVGYQICMAQNLRQKFGTAITTGQAALDAQLDALPAVPYSAETSFFSSGFTDTLLDGFGAAYNGVKQPQITLPAGVDPAAVKAVDDLCSAAKMTTLGQRPTSAPASCTKTDQCPSGLICKSAISTCVPDDALPEARCFNGSLGAAALSVSGAAIEVDIARSELEEYSERYDGAMRGCFILGQGNMAVEAAIEQHNGTMSELANAKFIADQIAGTASKARDLFSLEKPGQIIGSIVFGAVQQGAESVADTISLKMDEADRAHELTLQKLEDETEMRSCLNEASIELVGARSAALRIRLQSHALTQAIVAFNNLKTSFLADLDDGHSSLAAEKYRKVAVAQVDFWLDENLDLHQQRMRRARRALFLAILATEYEFQFTSLERAKALSAKTPTELEDSLKRVRDLVRRGAPSGGGNPTQLITVLSLKKNLLQLADRAGETPGAQQLDPTQRLQRLLTSPQYAVYAENGRYLGQEFPFSIQPLGTLGKGDTGAVPLLSGLNCAERVWAVNASVIGNDLMNGTDTSIATIQLRKRNTFASQLCSATTTTQDGLQSATTRPSQNLFIDPYSAGSWSQDSVLVSLTDTREASTYSFATVQARTNVPQRDLERLDYQDGQSTALAGRGVFGDYMLFIPATTQSIAGSVGLKLDRVSDVLIRLDYVAAELR